MTNKKSELKKSITEVEWKIRMVIYTRNWSNVCVSHSHLRSRAVAHGFSNKKYKNWRRDCIVCSNPAASSICMSIHWCNLHNKHRSIVLIAITPIWLHLKLAVDRFKHSTCKRITIEHNNHAHEMPDSYGAFVKIVCSFSGYLFFICMDLISFGSDVQKIANAKLLDATGIAMIPNIMAKWKKWHIETIERITCSPSHEIPHICPKYRWITVILLLITSLLVVVVICYSVWTWYLHRLFIAPCQMKSCEAPRGNNLTLSRTEKNMN